MPESSTSSKDQESERLLIHDANSQVEWLPRRTWLKRDGVALFWGPNTRLLLTDYLLVLLCFFFTALLLRNVFFRHWFLVKVSTLHLVFMGALWWWSRRRQKASPNVDLLIHTMTFSVELHFFLITLVAGGMEAPAFWAMLMFPLMLFLLCRVWVAVSWLVVSIGLGWCSVASQNILQLYEFRHLAPMSTLLGFCLGIGTTAAIVLCFRYVVDSSFTTLQRKEQLIREQALEMEKLRNEAEKASQVKSVFLANIGHEIRTPLNGVLGMASLLSKTPLGHEQREMTRTIEQSGRTLLGLLNDLLDFSKIEAGQMELEHSAFNVRACVENVLELFAQDVWEKDIDLHYHMPPSLTSMWVGDEFRLRQVLTNLVSNAVKFTSSGEIQVQIALEPKQGLRFHVQDTGVGIAQEHQERLFHAFQQAEPSVSRTYGGTGLGLSICKHLVEMMGGQITLQSLPGEGSTFSFWIQSTSVSGAPHLVGEWPDLRVLVIEPKPGTRHGFVRHLRAWSCQVEEAASQDRARQILQKQPFDLVFVSLPFREAQAFALPLEEELPQTTFVYMCSVAEAHFLQDSQEGKLAHVLLKPMRHQQLLALVRAQAEDRSLPTPEEMSSVPNFGALVPLRILVVEDNLINQQVVCQMLQRLGYKPDVVASGIEAVAYIEREPCDVVFMDMRLPGMDGPTATRMIRQRKKPAEGPYIIGLTANSKAEHRIVFEEAGLDDFMSKPILMEDLIYVLERFVQTNSSDSLDNMSLARLREAAARESSENLAQISTPSSNHKVIQHEPLAKLKRLCEVSSTSFSEMVEGHIRNSQELLSQLLQAHKAEQRDSLTAAAHTLKSTSALFGAAKVSALCEEIESLATETPFHALEELLVALEDAVSQAHHHLRGAIEP